MDAIFIDEMATRAKFGNFDYGGDENVFALNMAQYDLSQERFVDVSHGDIEARLESLYKMYLTFDWKQIPLQLRNRRGI